MKKFLSLVLALVMTMSLVTVSAGAKDFTDNSKINYKEAVDVMSAAKVIDGYAEGDFRPTNTLTRGAAAKIICNLILGPTTASALAADAAPYKDVPTNHTFAGYIAYCQKEGIISGYADGTFRPANSLTGYAFMKMLLGALGYKSENEGYTGANWSIQVAKRALNIGLDDDLVGDFNGVKAVNREEACLYAFNTLKATMVEYEKNSTVTVGNITIKDTSDAKEMTNTGKTDGNIDKDGKMQFAEKYFTDLKEFPSTDDFMRPATQWKIKSEEVGKYTDTADLTYTAAVKASDIYKDLDLGSNMAKKDVTVYINGEEATAASTDLKKSNDTKIGFGVYDDTKDKEVGTNGNGVLTEVFYDKDDDSVVITQVVTYVGQISKTVKATSKKDAYVVIETKASEQNEYAAVPYSIEKKAAVKSGLEFETDEKFDDDAYVLYTYSFKAGEVKSVAAAEKVEGYVSKTINKVNDTDKNNGMTLAGTEYKMSLATTGEKLGNVSVKQDYTAYLDQYGYIIYVEEIEEIGNYALLLNAANKGSFVGKKAELVFTDGTSKVVETEKDYTSIMRDGNDKELLPVIVTYKVDKDGVYTLKLVDNAKASYNDADTNLKLKNDKAGITITPNNTKEDGKFVYKQAASVTSNSATVFVVSDPKDSDDYTAYTGIKNAPSIKTSDASKNAAGVYVYCKSNNMVTVMFVLPQAGVSVEDDNNKLIFFAKKSVSDLIHDEDSDYFEYNAIVNGEIKTVKVDETVGNALNGLYKSFTTDKYGVVTKAPGEYTGYGETADKDPGDAKEYLEGTGIDKTSKEYTVTLDTVQNGENAVITVDDNAKIYYVDKDGNITESSYKSIAKDENDKVYAIVQDYLVKTLVIEEVENDDAGKDDDVKPGTNALSLSNSGVITVTLADKAAADTAVTVTVAQLNDKFSATQTVTVLKGKTTATLNVSKMLEDGKTYQVTATVNGESLSDVAVYNK